MLLLLLLRRWKGERRVTEKQSGKPNLLLLLSIAVPVLVLFFLGRLLGGGRRCGRSPLPLWCRQE
jgi:hypothetical protein